ncbi:MAG TPA: AMP-binding protein [Candidatus Hydrogenedentes bacterium]|nr:AMP-binding protein [Candidatus Hydrogenedentota bacterium]
MNTKPLQRLWQYVEYWAKQKPHAEALVFGEQRMSWAEFNEQVDHCARAFLELGVQKGERVALVAMACPEFLISFMAASKIGAIWLGISPKFSVDEVRYVLSHAQPVVLITLRDYHGVDLVEQGFTFQEEFPTIAEVLVIGKTMDGLLEFDKFCNRPRPEWDAGLAERLSEVEEEDEALLMYTSGATGKPKGVLHTHQTIIQNAAVEVEYFSIHQDDRVLLHFPINHVAADVEIGFGAIYAGATLVMMDHFDAAASLDLIEKEKITFIGQIPTMYLMQMQTPGFESRDWSNIQKFIWGGTTASLQMIETLGAIAQKTGAHLLTGYGATEVCGFVTFTDPDATVEHLSQSVGKAAPPYEMRIVGPDRQPLPAGQMGELAFRGPTLMKGYLNAPVQTAEVMDKEGWYYTQDLAHMDDAGNIFLVGRSSEMFKSGGENVFPREIEDVLESHDAVLFAAVLGISDELFGEVGHAFVVLKPGYQVASDVLQKHCREHLATFKVPKRIEIRAQLPLLPSGKVNKLVLRSELKQT